jgi:predicted Zn finger-like uncharacterized protein
MITTTCPHCRTGLKVQAQHAGKKVRCPKCKEVVPIPAASEPVSAEPAEEEGVGGAPPEAGQEVPAGELTDHRGEPLPEDAEFFKPPPAAIGQVLSGYTTLRKGMRHAPAWLVVTAPLAAGVAGIAFGIWLSGTSPSMGRHWRYLFPIVFGLLGSGLLFLIVLFSHSETYVGKEGIARYDCFLTRNILSLKDLLRFEDAADLYSFTLVHFVNGAYSSTDYIYSWHDAQNRLVHVLKGAYHARDGKPPAEHLFNFAWAAERAWTDHRMPIALRELQDPGYVQFNISKLFGNSWVRLYRDKVTLKLKGKPTRIPIDSINAVEIEEGILYFRLSILAAAGDTPSSYQLTLNDLANRQLFLRLLKKLYGLEAA